jgi:hypothetical protein
MLFWEASGGVARCGRRDALRYRSIEKYLADERNSSPSWPGLKNILPELKTVLPNLILFSEQRVNFSADFFAHSD